jgi:hypothetical protein
LKKPAIWDEVDITGLNKNISKIVEAYNKGQMDEILCGLPRTNLPEYTKYSEDGNVIIRGYKDIVHILVQKRIITWEKADKYFGYDPNYDWFHTPGARKHKFREK